MTDPRPQLPTALLACLLCLLSAAAAPAQEPAVPELDLRECIRIGLDNSLSLDNARIDKMLADERATAAGALLDPRISASTTHTDSKIADMGSFLDLDKQITQADAELSKAFATGTRMGLTFNQSKFASTTNSFFSFTPYNMSVAISVSQSILRNAFGELDRAILAYADSGRQIAALLYTRKENVFCSRVAGAYWRLYAAHQSHAVGHESLLRARMLLETTKSRFKDGLMDETDVLAAEAMIATRTVDVNALEQAVENAADSLKNRIQLRQIDWDSVRFRFPDEKVLNAAIKMVSPDDQHARRVALLTRNDLAALRKVAKQAELDLQMKRSAARPDLQLIGSFARGAAADTIGDTLELSDTAWTIGFQFEMPFGRVAERSGIRQSQFLLRQAHNTVLELESAVALECRIATRNLQNAIERVGAMAKAAELQKRKLAAEQTKFEQGRSDTRWLIQYEDDAARARMSYHLAVGDYHMSLALYRLAQGYGRPTTKAKPVTADVNP